MFRFKSLLMALLVMGALLVCAPGSPFAQTAAIAQVKTLEGTASLLRGGQTLALAVGDDLFVADILKTAADSALGISFADNSLISLGSNSEMEISAFAFEPSRNDFSFLSRLLQGTLLYVSGIMAKLSPEDVKLETPVATVTVRGTRMLIRAE